MLWTLLLGTLHCSTAFVLPTAASQRQRLIKPRHPTAVGLEGSSWKITLNVGREKGTWMPEQWAASGARLSLPLELTFTDEPIKAQWLQPLVDPDEPSLGPDTRKLRVRENGSFVGAQGLVAVEVLGGAWCAQPTGRCGESRLNFYLDFPEGCSRNDVSIPAGRVFFRTACWDSDELGAAQAKAEAVRDELLALTDPANERTQQGNLFERANALRAEASRSERVEELQYALQLYRRALPGPDGSIAAPGGLRLAKAGGLSIKVNDAKNLCAATVAEPLSTDTVNTCRLVGYSAMFRPTSHVESANPGRAQLASLGTCTTSSVGSRSRRWPSKVDRLSHDLSSHV